jgi:methionyl-tRNA synthetase
LREHAEQCIVDAFEPEFDDLNFSEALTKACGTSLPKPTAISPPTPLGKTRRPQRRRSPLQARVLATAAEAIRIITALVYPILPDAAAKVWRQLGQGEIADAAKQSFLTISRGAD